VRILVAITGASGALYAQRLLDNLDPQQHEIHVVQSNYAHTVIHQELPGGLRLPPGVQSHGLKSMNAPFASGSNPVDAMVVIPCTMGTLGRIAHGFSEDVLLRVEVVEQALGVERAARPGDGDENSHMNAGMQETVTPWIMTAACVVRQGSSRLGRTVSDGFNHEWTPIDTNGNRH